MKRLHILGEEFDSFGFPLVEQAEVDVVDDEIDFWADQLMEHAMLISLGSADAEVKNRATILAKEFHTFLDTEFSDTDSRVGQVRGLSKELREFQVECMDRLNAGEWIGWLTPTYFDHITRELDYFMHKISEPMSLDDEMDIWLPLLAEHAGTLANLLDPSEEANIGESRAFVGRITGLPEHNLDAVQKIAKELDSFFVSEQESQEVGKLKSVIHPMLLQHVIDEGQRFLKILQAAKGK